VALRLCVAAVILAVAVVVAWWIQRRRPAPPPRDAYPVPRQLIRGDFARPDAPWLVAYFSSRTCAGCGGLGPKVAMLESDAVATCELSYEDDSEIHERYDIAAIPMILVADAEGVVQRAFIGATTATDLWAAVAEVREPGTTPEPELGSLA
jgi:hypothetical protein